MSTAGPSVFISYQHGDKPIARALAEGLRDEGLEVWIDEDELLAGDSLIERISTAVEGIDFFCALVSQTSVKSRWCQKELSLAMTGELGREGVTVIPVRVGAVPMPASLADKLYIELDPADVDGAVERITRDVRRHRKRRDQFGAKAATGAEHRRPASRPAGSPTAPEPGTGGKEPIRIVGVAKQGVGMPRNDGTRGSGLYRIPLRLSRTPSRTWADLFVQTWDHPPRYTTMHRPGIARVQADTIVLDGTTMDELEAYHVETLRLVVEKVNAETAKIEAREEAEDRRRESFEQGHRRALDDIAGRLDFG
jgi:hypothetical protein